MKKLIVAAAAAALLPIAYANAASNNVGCGLGSTVWEGETGLAPQVLAATTNGTSGNQTFGITSGTSGCSKDDGKVMISKFTGDNLDKLAREMAVGEGETLNSLAELMNIKAQDKPVFFDAVKAHFAQIFPTEEATTAQVLDSLNQVLAAHPALAHYAAS
ncbi:MAG: DUF3015 domain-containing protein [Gammaproteobacteria bacterium]|nr:DUF3015 domain-containing protein [Gammaproteobacteria bacterium]